MDDEAVHSIRVIWMIGNGGIPKSSSSAGDLTLVENDVEPLETIEMSESLFTPMMENGGDVGDKAAAEVDRPHLSDERKVEQRLPTPDAEIPTVGVPEETAEISILRPTEIVDDAFSPFLHHHASDGSPLSGRRGLDMLMSFIGTIDPGEFLSTGPHHDEDDKRSATGSDEEEADDSTDELRDDSGREDHL